MYTKENQKENLKQFSFFQDLHNEHSVKPLNINSILINNPKYFWFVDKSDVTAEVTEEKKLLLSDIEKKLGITWSENIWGDNKINNFVKQFNSEPPNSFDVSPELQMERLNEINQKCVIRWFDDIIGWTLMLRRGETLSKGFLCLYTGILKQYTDAEWPSFTYKEREYLMSLIECDQTHIDVDAGNLGNAMRLLPFLPDDELLKNFDVNANIEKDIATANLGFSSAYFNGIKLPTVNVLNNITAPKDHDLILGVNYSLNYLCKMNDFNLSFRLLDKHKLKQLDPNHYHQKIIQVELEGTDFLWNIPRARIIAGLDQPHLRNWKDVKNKETGAITRFTLNLKDMYQEYIKNPQANKITLKPMITILEQTSNPESRKLNPRA